MQQYAVVLRVCAEIRLVEERIRDSETRLAVSFVLQITPQTKQTLSRDCSSRAVDRFIGVERIRRREPPISELR